MSDIIKFDTSSEQKIIVETKILDLVPENDPILKQIIPEFDFNDSSIDPTDIASQLVETCKKYKGHGLSANQCGLNYRVFVMGAEDEYVACFNPSIIASSTETTMSTEGCLSFPYLVLNVERSNGIVVEYKNHLGELKTENYTGMTANIFQHELDHLNGICYTSRAKPVALSRGLKKRQKFNKLINRYSKAKKVIDKISE